MNSSNGYGSGGSLLSRTWSTRPANRVVVLVSAIVLVLLLVSCGSGEEALVAQSTQTAGSPANPESVVQSTPDATAGNQASPTAGNRPVLAATSSPKPTPPLFAGYDLELSEGDFWRFRWEFLDRTCAQGSGCKTTGDDGVFQVTLGTPKEWKGATVFAVDTSGQAGYSDDGNTRSFKLNWTYIGVVGNRIVATDGFGDSPLVTLFDAQTGRWAGSGFFTDRFSGDELVEASAGRLTDSSEFASWEGVQTGPWNSVTAAAGQGKCEIIEGRKICPREESFNYTETEYFRPGIGPFAYRYSFAASFSGGGFTTSFQTEERVALVASSFAGDDPTELVVVTPATPEPATSTPASTTADLADPLFGPVDGGLELSPGSIDIPDFSSGVDIDHGVVQVTFENPDVPGNRWSHGITFRQSGEEVFHAVFITGDGIWGQFARGGTSGGEVTPAAGRFEFDTRPGALNTLTLSFGVLGSATSGSFWINGQKVADLDLSFAPALGPGDVRVMSGLFPADEMNGATTNFTGFAVFDLP